MGGHRPEPLTGAGNGRKRPTGERAYSTYVCLLADLSRGYRV